MAQRNFGLKLLTVPVFAAFFAFLSVGVQAVAQTQPSAPTRQELLRGTITPEREWWNVLHYDLSVQFLPETRSIKGSNVITFKTLKRGRKMQIDLQPPLEISRIVHGTSDLTFEREGNVFWVSFDKELPAGVEDKIEIFYGGRPREARNPPWEGGVS